MELIKLSSNSKALMEEIIQADNPSEFLCQKFKGITQEEDTELRAMIRELREGGYINIKWADGIPYYVTANNAARTYSERLAEYEKERQQMHTTIIDNSVKIGDGNTISDSTIASSIVKSDKSDKKSFFDRHPVVCGIFISVCAGVILLFSFWSQIIEFLEGLF